jgi:hypothetical protein
MTGDMIRLVSDVAESRLLIVVYQVKSWPANGVESSLMWTGRKPMGAELLHAKTSTR